MKTHIAICLDSSSSMYSLTDATIKAFNDRVYTIKNLAKKRGHDVRVTLITFADNCNIIFQDKSVEDLVPLTRNEYRPYGNTALFDAVGLAIEKLSCIKLGKNDACLVETITDGEENRSRNYAGRTQGWFNNYANKKDLAQEIQRCTNTGKWTLAFMVPRGRYKSNLNINFGIPIGSIEEWDQTEIGTYEAERKTSLGLTSYFNSRSAGETAVKSFYVNTNMDNVKPSDIKRKLDDISSNFKVWSLQKEEVVKDFVEAKTKKPYVVGSTYYQLMKNEKVQPQKSVLIMEKGKTAVWGGPAARDLIGLPAGAVAKVEPGNHANYDIFVQSTSVNRKLPRGTKVLVDVTRQKGCQPTWGSV